MTMIRTLLCTILIGAACQANAATLYRWAEADGSLTFSPEPPPAGIAYDTVDTGGGNLASQPSTSADQNLEQDLTAASAVPAATGPARTVAGADATSEPEIKISAVPLDVQNAPAAAEAPQTLAYAPNTAKTLPQGITAASNSEDVPAAAAQNGVVGSTQKFNQCQELQKRVVSLERRLRSKLSSDDVDNTVVAIVRYQKSFDAYCE